MLIDGSRFEAPRALAMALVLAGCSSFSRPTPALGTPCFDDASCGDSSCEPAASGNVCSRTCADHADCPAGWSCRESARDTLGGQRVCRCDGEGRETCDGEDDDCDGRIDEAPGGTELCGPGGRCESGRCRSGLGTRCGTDAECVSGACRAGTCQQPCTGDGECPGGFVCAGGECACGGEGVERCDGDDDDCDGRIDEGELCPGGGCEAGACRCDSGEACDGGCFDVTRDPLHCGACDNACPTGATCEAGTCSCALAPHAPADAITCDGACTDLSSDPEHCGACDVACAAGASCVGGHCECDEPLQADCGGTCVDNSSDPAHCGTCGRACTGEAVCVYYECRPPVVFEAPDDDSIAFLDEHEGTVCWVTRAGRVGCVQDEDSTLTPEMLPIGPPGPAHVVAMAVSESGVLVARARDSSGSGPAILYRSRTGSPNEVLLPLAPAISGVTVAAGAVTVATGSIVQLLDGDQAVLLPSTWARDLTSTFDPVSGNDTLVWRGSSGIEALEVTEPGASGERHTIVPDPAQFYAEDGVVYWAEDGVSVRRAPVGGGPASLVVTIPVAPGELPPSIQAFAGDASDLFVIHRRRPDLQLLRVRLPGGSPETIFTLPPSDHYVQAIVLAPTGVYYAVENRVHRVTRP